jgi:hypothetical protein
MGLPGAERLPPPLYTLLPSLFSLWHAPVHLRPEACSHTCLLSPGPQCLHMLLVGHAPGWTCSWLDTLGFPLWGLGAFSLLLAPHVFRALGEVKAAPNTTGSRQKMG